MPNSEYQLPTTNVLRLAEGWAFEAPSRQATTNVYSCFNAHSRTFPRFWQGAVIGRFQFITFLLQV